MPHREQQHEEPRPRDHASQPPNRVDEASEESFPASDPPSWSPTHAGSPEEHHAEGTPRRDGAPGDDADDGERRRG